MHFPQDLKKPVADNRECCYGRRIYVPSVKDSKIKIGKGIGLNLLTATGLRLEKGLYPEETGWSIGN